MKFTKIYLLAVAIICFSAVSFSQIRDRDEDSKSSSQKLLQQQQQQMSGTSLSVIMDGPVDPTEYIVGPGDIFSVSIWSAIPLNFQIPVTPEGTVVIPTVNEVAISGLTLETAKILVVNEIKKKYLSGQASFTLSQPRSFTVSIKGLVLREQTLVVQATQRVEAALSIANDIQKYKLNNIFSEQSLLSSGKIEKILSTSSKRNIRIVRKDGTSVNADMEKYSATSNHTFNPLLRDGDVIIVPPSDIEKNFIGVYGAVVKNDRFEYVEGDSLQTVIAIAGGITSNADFQHTMITRATADGGYSEIPVDLEKIISGQQSDIPLQRGDRIFIGKKNSVDRGGVVTIEGEVQSPGSYSIIQDSTKLSEVVQKSGGFTKYASLNGATILRTKSAPTEEEIEYLQLRKGFTTAEDTAYFSNEISLHNKNGIVSVDFVALFEKNDNTKDITLQSGDRIIVPASNNAIYVFGEVKSPGYIKFKQGRDAAYYISLAGGKTDRAEAGDIQIIKAGTKQWLSPSETAIQEGDYVWVPKEPYRTTSYYLQIYSQLFGIIATTVSLVILTSQYTK